MSAIREAIYRLHRMKGRAEGYRNAADSIEQIMSEHPPPAELGDALRELVTELREQADKDEP